MSDARTCPDCGAVLPDSGPEGLCPLCLIRAGLGSGALNVGRSGETAPTMVFDDPGGVGVLETIAATLGPAPRILLRDTDAGFEPPLVRPGREAGGEASTRYRIDGEIARGGMGSVLKGRDPDLGRDVAIKVLREDHRDNPEMVRRFIEEAQIGGQLQHPGIVPIYELGQFADLRPFFSMKLVKGHTLAALLEARKDPASDLPRFLNIVEAIAQTVGYAHARGVIHRDLKPSNVMVGSFGEVQVMDWGLAKVLPRGGAADDATAGKPDRQETVIATARSGSDDSDLSRAGSAMGTPSYMAPEQARGEVDRVDERADVFALGSILCEVLTGKPAFVGRSGGEIQRKAALGDLADPFARLDACGADLELVALAKDCLAREPEDRPREAGAVSSRVTAHLAGVQERLRSAERERAVSEARVVEERKRRRLTLALAASIVLLLASGVGGWAWLATRRERVGRQVGAALEQAVVLRARALATPSELGLWSAAREQAQRAAALAEAGPVDPALRGRVREMEDALDQDRKDQTFLAAIDKAWFDYDPTRIKEVATFRKAFADYGLPAGQGDAGAIAARIQARPASFRDALAATLDTWLRLEVSRRLRDPKAQPTHLEDWLKGLIAAVDDDPWRRRVREAFASPGGAAKRATLTRLADEADVARQPTRALLYLTEAMFTLGDDEAAIALLRGAQLHRPGDVVLNDTLGSYCTSTDPPRWEEAARCSMAAVALRPDVGPLRNGLAWALGHLDRTEEALAQVREAIRLDPGDGATHDTHGYLLLRMGRIENAFAAFSEAARQWPDEPGVRSGFALSLINLDRVDEGVAALREMIRRRPEDARLHVNLADVLGRSGRFDGVIAELRKAVALDSGDAFAHHLLASYLIGQREYGEAVAEGRIAVGLTPGQYRYHRNLALALRGKGDYQAAIAEFRTFGELLRLEDIALIKDRSEEETAETERLAKLAERLPSVLRGRDRPKDAAERIGLAEIAANRGLYAVSARLYGEAIDPDAKPDDLVQYNARHQGAAMAALAGCGQGKDDPPPDETAKAELRRRAREWLRANLAVKAGELEKGALGARRTRANVLVSWKNNPDFAGVRDAGALERLPEEEREAWRTFWAEVDAVVKRSRQDHP